MVGPESRVAGGTGIAEEPEEQIERHDIGQQLEQSVHGTSICHRADCHVGIAMTVWRGFRVECWGRFVRGERPPTAGLASA